MSPRETRIRRLRAPGAVRRPGLVLLVCAAGLAAFAYSVFGSAPSAPGEKHWAAAPLLAFSIVLSMGGLVALATARRGSLK